jgi:hypothetical protein
MSYGKLSYNGFGGAILRGGYREKSNYQAPKSKEINFKGTKTVL